MFSRPTFPVAAFRRLAAFITSVALLASLPTTTRASSWSPTLLVNTEAFQVIDDGDGSTDIELRFGDTANEILRWDISEGAFIFTDDVTVQGNLDATGNLSASGTLSVESTSSLQGNVTVTGTVDTTGSITTDGDLTINEDNGDATATLTFGNDAGAETLAFDNSTNQFELSDDLDVSGALSGATVHSQGLLTASGGLAIEGSFTGATAFYMNSLVDCNGTSNKLTYNASTGLFSCETDETGAGAAWTDGGDFLHPADNSGAEDVIVGANTEAAAEIKLGTGGNIRARGTISGAALRISGPADVHGALTASGAIRSDGNLTINDDADSNNAVLTFGSDGTNETLTWLNTQDTFQFSDDLNITGQLSASGGLSVEGSTSIQGAATFGSTTSFGGVTYTWPGADGAASGSILATDGAGQLTWASGIASSGSIVTLQPEYDGAVYFSSGGTFVGQLIASGSVALSGTPENFYRWTTTRTSNQDYWISTRVRIPNNFSSWDAVAPIQFRYRGSGGTLDLRLLDTADAAVTLTGGADLTTNGTSWSTATITGPESTGTYTADDHITVLVKLTASGTTVNDEFADAGWIELNWETKD